MRSAALAGAGERDLSGIVVMGSSHIAAIQAAWSAETDPPIEFYNFWHKIGDETPFLARVIEARAGRPPPAHVVLAFGANNHNAIGLVRQDPPFAIGTRQGQVPPPETGRTLIPRDVMRAVLRHQIAIWSGMKVAVHRRFAGAAFYHVQGPPPVDTFVWSADDPGLTEAKRAVLTRMTTEAADPAVRLALYRLQMEITTEEGRRLGAVVIDAPKAAMTRQGYLAPGFWAQGDPTHGNPRYGRLVLDQIIASCGAAA